MRGSLYSAGEIKKFFQKVKKDLQTVVYMLKYIVVFFVPQIFQRRLTVVKGRNSS